MLVLILHYLKRDQVNRWEFLEDKTEDPSYLEALLVLSISTLCRSKIDITISQNIKILAKFTSKLLNAAPLELLEKIIA